MENLTGFIVGVRAKGDCPVYYSCDNEMKLLAPDEVFIGYFRQSVGSKTGSTKAYIHETRLVDAQEKRFVYGKEAVFDSNEVTMEIIALRGPEGNNRFLPPDYDQKYDTWNLVQH